MSPAAFVEAASAWALAPGFRRVQDGRGLSADTTAADRRPLTQSVGTVRDDARGPAMAAFTGTRPWDRHVVAGLPAARRHVTGKGEAA